MTDCATQPKDSVLVETHIEAAPAVVWQALTEGIGAWWPAEFYIGGEEGGRSYHLEAHPGGRMYEEWDDGGGLLWGRVVTVIPESKLQVTSVSFPEWGGPSMSFGTWTLEEADGGCALRFTEHVLGTTPQGYLAEKHKGWSFLFAGVLKAHLEGTPLPKWEG